MNSFMQAAYIMRTLRAALIIPFEQQLFAGRSLRIISPAKRTP